VYLGDKATMWNDDRSAFVMYGVQGRSWVALGDPVGPPETSRDLVRMFLEQTHGIGVTPVFYQVSAERLADYADYGLALVKIGEEARVWLPSFTLSGAHQKPLRAVMNRMEREAISFRVAPPDEVVRLMPELREISDEWVATKRTAEKGFSLGFFQPEYIRRFPAALIERGGRVEAFANLWLGAGRVELSPDLMRHRDSAPKGIMDALLTHMMLWGRDRGYDWFNLGVAPLSGLPLSPVGHPWGRLGRFVYRYGEAYYNFRGLRAYKEKFHPVWQPRYLAYPGGLTLPRVLADVTALVAGGYRHIFVRGVRHVA
jgi:phosphatidylglycerol lysyltransferase